MKRLLISFLFLFLPLMADSERFLLEEAIKESAITPQQKIAVNNYFQNLILKKEKQLQILEDKLLLSYGGKIQRDKIIKENIKSEIDIIHNQIEYYKIVSNGFTK